MHQLPAKKHQVSPVAAAMAASRPNVDGEDRLAAILVEARDHPSAH